LLLTGSVRAELSNELWAGTGRVVRTTMYGLTAREINGDVAPTQPPFLTRLARGAVETFRLPTVPPTIDDYLALAVRGSFPELAYRDRNERARGIWLSGYLDDLVTRDAAALDQNKNPAKCAATSTWRTFTSIQNPMRSHQVRDSIMRMCTSLDLDEDVQLAVKERARRERRSAGDVLSELAREALTGQHRESEGLGTERHGFRTLPRRGAAVSNALIDRLREDESA